MRSLPFKKSALFLCALVACQTKWAEGYIETAQPGLPESWQTPEFANQWGLESTGAHYAYARGYNGKGISIGIFDQAVYTHPAFMEKLDKVDSSEPYNFSGYEPHPESGNFIFGDHGTHVAGIAAASRNGQQMHGVAYNSGLISAKYLDSNTNYFEQLIQSNTRIFNNSWEHLLPIEKDENGNLLFFPDGRPRYKEISKQEALGFYSTDEITTIGALSATPAPLTKLNTWSSEPAAILRAARSGKLLVFAAGNDNNYNVPVSNASLPYFFPDTLNNFLITTNLTQKDELALSSTRCGYTASYCLSAPGTDIYSARGQTDYGHYFETGEKKIIPTYGVMSGTSMAAPMVSGAAAVLMQRFPYMTAAQISTVLLTTATDLGEKGIDEVYGWGKLNLRSAIDGPRKFATPADIPNNLYIEGSYTQTQFIANIPGIGAVVESGTSQQRICDASECGFDSWTNDIDGHGGLTKTGRGMLTLTGENSYLGPTLIAQGTLVINGTVSSDVSVLNSGTLAGYGNVGSLIARRGSTVAPGNGIGTLKVAHNVRFEPGSRYKVEAGADGRSDRIQSGGLAKIDGGEVAVSLQNGSNLLSLSEVRSLLGQQYSILNARQGVSGRFDSVAPDYLFLGTALNYQPNQVTLHVGRNATSFTSVAKTANERAVAAAADALKAENPVHESILSSGTVSEARQAFRQLSGQIHADIASALMNSSRYLRETLNERLRQAEGLAELPGIRAGEGGAWARLAGAWDHASGNVNATGYRASTWGVLMGLDQALADDGRTGIATGYTRTSLDGGYGSNAKSDNYFMAMYGSKRYGALALRAGGGYTWHRIDTARSVNYGLQSDHEKAKYGARTEQAFVETGYSVKTGWMNLEPFANLSHTNFKDNGLAERGGAAALTGNRQHSDATISTVGLRADSQWQAGKAVSSGLISELGWQHQYGNRYRDVGVRFNGGQTPFVVNSVPVSRNGMVLKSSLEVVVNNNATLSLGYAGLLSQNHQGNGVNAGFAWRF